MCDIFQLDLEAILTIIGNASCFSEPNRTQALRIRDELVNKWMRVVIEEWTPGAITSSFAQMRELVQHGGRHESLDKAEKGLLADHPLTSVLMDIRKYRESIRIG